MPGPGLCAPKPEVRVATLVTDGEYNNSLCFDAVDDGIGKAPHEKLLRTAAHWGSNFGVLLKTAEGTTCLFEEVRSQAGGFLLIKARCPAEIRLGSAQQDHGNHRWSSARSWDRASAAETASSSPAK